MPYALIVIDMQNDFLSGALGSREALATLPGIVDRVFRANEDADCAQILFTMDTHHAGYLDTQEGKKLPVPHCISGTEGWSIAEPLRACFGPKTIILEKGTFGCIDLPSALRDGLSHVELMGVCTDICVISNAMLLKAYRPELPILVNAALCAGVTHESHERALQAMEACQIDIRR